MFVLLRAPGCVARRNLRRLGAGLVFGEDAARGVVYIQTSHPWAVVLDAAGDPAKSLSCRRAAVDRPRLSRLTPMAKFLVLGRVSRTALGVLVNALVEMSPPPSAEALRCLINVLPDRG
jgi:hypothetical protein